MGGNMIGGILEKIGWQILLPTERLIDFDLAASLAFDIAGEEMMDSQEKEHLAKDYFQAVAELTPLVTQHIGMGNAASPAPVIVFDRREWIVVNLENLKFFIEPLSRSYWESLIAYSKATYPRGGRAVRKISNVTVTSELGLLIGYFSRRVLAQYDWQVPNPETTGRLLYFVEPNIREWEKRLHLQTYRAREWICLHEAVHSLQFDLHAWLEDYILTLLREYIGLAEKALVLIEEKLSKEKTPLSWTWLWWKELVGPRYQSLVGKIQAVMSLLEGYSDHIMLEVGKQNLPYDQYLLDVLQRRAGRSIASLLLERLMGFHLKLRQYELGERFVRTVVERKGLQFLNQVWQSPETLPTWQEIHYPGQWIRRME
jgi:coenzyme F420 biosynthesis associated uncharacterized protein